MKFPTEFKTFARSRDSLNQFNVLLSDKDYQKVITCRNVPKTKILYFLWECSRGTVPVTIYPIKTIHELLLHRLFTHVCANGLIEAAKWIYGVDPKFINFEESMASACRYSHLDLAK